jgi:hypothetical protein
MRATNCGFVARLGEMFQHQVGLVGGEFQYPARAQRVVRMPQGVNRHRRQAF